MPSWYSFYDGSCEGIEEVVGPPPKLTKSELAVAILLNPLAICFWMVLVAILLGS